MANPLFNAVYYLTQNPDVFAAGYTVDTAYDHYTQFGADEAYVAGGLVRAPNPWFDVKYYLTQNADLIAGGVTPETALDHFLTYGAIEGRFPDAAVAANPITEAGLLAYAKANPDLLTAFRIEEDATELTEAQQNELTLQFYSYGYNESRPAAPTVFDVPDDTFTLTVNPDVATANVFDAPRGWTPGGTDQMNTLNDDDVLTGTGDNPTLNVDFVDSADIPGVQDTITPELRGIETINVNALGTLNKTLDLQDASGVDSLNVSRVNSAAFTFANIADAVGSMSVNNTQANANVSFNFLNSALSGAEDEAEVTLNNVDIGTLRIQAPGEGYETLTMNSVGSDNEVDLLGAEDLQTLTLSGDQDLTLGSSSNITGPGGRVEGTLFNAGLANVAGSLDTIDASAMTGDIQIHLGEEVTATRDGTSGVAVDFTYTGSQGDDDVVLTAGMDSDDTIDGGEGENTLVTTASLTAGQIENFQTLDVVGQGGGVLPVATTIIVDTSIIGGLESVQIRNEGQFANAGAAQTLTTTLNNVSAEVAQNITLLHGNSGNNGIAANVVNVNTVAAATSVGITLEDGVNVDPRFNATLNTSNNVDNVSITDNDSESNTVRLGNVANIDGSITLTGGAAGQFMNLDVQNVLPAGGQAGLYGYQTNGTLAPADNAFVTDIGAAGAARLEAATIDAAAYAGNVVVRVSEADNATGAQTITMGAGNDTVIFDALNDNTAGLTISDTVDGGEGNDTLAIDGDGVNVSISASEWTNVSNFETIHLVGNGQADNNGLNQVNAYNLTLTNDLIAANGSAITGGRSIAIVNDNGGAGASANAGVTIDARTLNAQSTFSYDGQETDAVAGTTMTADRFILSDANVNGLAVIDGGADVTTIGAGQVVAGHNANADVLEVRNASVVTIGDLVGISNVGTIQFTNDQAVTQTSQLVLDSATVDRLVNNTRAADSANRETLSVQAVGNAIPAGTINTALDLDARQVGGDFALNINTSLDSVGLATNAGADSVMTTINLGGAVTTLNLGVGVDTVSFYGAAANSVGGAYNAATGVFTPGTANTINLTADTAVQFQNAAGISTVIYDFVATGSVDNLDLSNVTGLAGQTITAAATTTSIVGGVGDDTINADVSGGATLNGGAGNDTINGAAGDDIIIGGTGADILTGGAGNDVFVFATGSGNTTTVIDSITDFATGADTIKTGTSGVGEFSTAVVAGTNDYAQALTNANAAMVGGDKFYFAAGDGTTTDLSAIGGSAAGADGVLFVDWDDNGTADQAILLVGGVTGFILATDIVV